MRMDQIQEYHAVMLSFMCRLREATAPSYSVNTNLGVAVKVFRRHR